MTFSSLQLIEPILRALQNEGYENPTPIQQQSIPLVLSGRDLLGCAQTGTGKTAAFSLPILQLLHQQGKPQGAHRPIRTLILTPTRELAIQIGESIETYGKFLNLRHLVVFGGVGQQPQVDGLRRGIDILVATPGRLLDLINQKFISLQHLQFFVLDEADRMLDMGFIHDVRRVISLLPARRQSLFFSATMPPEVLSLANSLLIDPAEVSVTPVSSTADTVAQQVYFVEKNNKRALLAHLLREQNIPRVLVFTRTKHGADRVAKDLKKIGIPADSIHGDKAQNARQKALKQFKEHKIRVLVATDIAARGIDVDDLTHVINFEIPNIAETYVHRIGRTGRAGASGNAISFCDEVEAEYLRDIQKLIGKKVPIIEGHPFAMPIPSMVLQPIPAQRAQQPVKNGSRPQQQNSQNQKLPQRKPAPQQSANSQNISKTAPQPPANQQKTKPDFQKMAQKPAENVQKEMKTAPQLPANQQKTKPDFQKMAQKPAENVQKEMKTEQNLLTPRSQSRVTKSQGSNPTSVKNDAKKQFTESPRRKSKNRFDEVYVEVPKVKPVPPSERNSSENEPLTEAEKRKKRLESFGGLFKI